MSLPGVYVATEVFADVLEDAKVIAVDPSACIPFLHIRNVVRSGVERIKHSYSENSGDSIASGAFCGTSLPTVVVLSGPFYSHIENYFMAEHGLDKRDAKMRAESRDVWYGVVDGLHRLLALLELQTEKPQRWAGFKWTVLLLQGVQSMQCLRGFARSQNATQSSENYVETTLYDSLHGMQEESKKMAAECGGRDPTTKQLAERYSSTSERTSTSTRNLAAVALKLSQRVVSVIGEITNFECAKLACTYYAVRGCSTYTESTILQQADCRVYRNFLTVTSLRNSSAFLNARGEDAEDLQVNTLFRLKDICRGSGFKPVSGATVVEQYWRSTEALKEAKKFEKLLRSDVWPRGMEKLQDNLLRSTVLDDDVKANEGNERDILPAIVQHFRRCVPQRAALLEARYFSTLEMEGADREAIQTTEAAAEVLDEGRQKDHNRNGPRTDDGEVVLTQQPQEESMEKIDGHELLQKYGVTCFQMSWQQYNRTLHSNTDTLFDLILTEPPSGLTSSKARVRKGVDEFLDKREMQQFAQFAQRVLVPGGYLLLFAPVVYFREWITLLRANDFSCANFPFIIAKDSRGMQRENRLLFPQNVCDHMIMAVSRGKNSKGFEPDFNEAYKLIPCAYKRKFAAIDRVPVVRSKLKYVGCRSQVCTTEKNPDLLAELMETFSPPEANVLDPYAGTMSTGAASLRSNRRCTLIEKDPECFSQAFRRLVGYCKAEDIERVGKASAVRRLMLNTKNVEGQDVVEAERGRLGDCSNAEASDVKAIGTESSGRNFDECSNDEAGGVISGPHAPSIETRNDNAENCEEVISSSGGAFSIPSVPSSPIEKPTQDSQNGKGKAKLIVNGEIVATADIAIDYEDVDPQSYRRILHGQSLTRFEKDGEHLIVVWNVAVTEKCKEFAYPYSYGGIEGPVRCLGEMETGFHEWDLNAVRFDE